jgi:hypothetical protein
MADGWTIDDIDACALTTAVDLLDALLDSAALARPGCDAAPYARDLRYLGDSAAVAAADLAVLLPMQERRAVA